MFRKISWVIYGICIIAVVISCKKDKNNPTITIVEPENHSEHMIGSDVNVVVSFKDDQALKSYHIYIGNEVGDQMPEFVVEFTNDITGKSYDFNDHFTVPIGVSSVYYLHFEVMDAEGKTASDKLMLHFM